MRRGWAIAAGLIGVGLVPVIAGSAGSALATAGGCRAGVEVARPCHLGGFDWAGVLDALTRSEDLFVLTAPITLAGVLLAILLATRALLRRLRD